MNCYLAEEELEDATLEDFIAMRDPTRFQKVLSYEEVLAWADAQIEAKQAGSQR